MQNGDEGFAEHHYSRSVASDLTMQVLSVYHIKDVKQAKVTTWYLRTAKTQISLHIRTGLQVDQSI